MLFHLCWGTEKQKCNMLELSLVPLAAAPISLLYLGTVFCLWTEVISHRYKAVKLECQGIHLMLHGQTCTMIDERDAHGRLWLNMEVHNVNGHPEKSFSSCNFPWWAIGVNMSPCESKDIQWHPTASMSIHWGPSKSIQWTWMDLIWPQLNFLVHHGIILPMLVIHGGSISSQSACPSGSLPIHKIHDRNPFLIQI